MILPSHRPHTVGDPEVASIRGSENMSRSSGQVDKHDRDDYRNPHGRGSADALWSFYGTARVFSSAAVLVPVDDSGIKVQRFGTSSIISSIQRLDASVQNFLHQLGSHTNEDEPSRWYSKCTYINGGCLTNA